MLKLDLSCGRIVLLSFKFPIYNVQILKLLVDRCEDTSNFADACDIPNLHFLWISVCDKPIISNILE